MIEGLDKNDYEKIDKYLNGLLIDNELTEFEVRLQNESKLKNEVDAYIELNEGLAYKFNSNKDEVKATLNDLGEQYFLKRNKKRRREEETAPLQTKTFTKPEEAEIELSENDNHRTIKPLYLLATFAAAAALLLFIFINPFTNKPHYSQLAVEYFDEGYVYSNVRGQEDNNPSPKELLSKGSEYFKANEIEQATQTFQKVTQEGSSIYKQIANWYLALCYLKQNNPNKAKPLLQELQSHRDFGEDAKSILKQLK